MNEWMLQLLRESVKHSWSADSRRVRVRSVCVRALRRLQGRGDARERLSDLLVRGFERGEVLAVWVVDFARRRQHRTHERRVHQHRIQTVLERVALDQAVAAAIRAQVGEIGQKERAAAAAWGELDYFLTLVLGEAQDEVAAHRDLRRQPLRMECGRVDAVLFHKTCARRVDGVVDEPLDACTVRHDRIVMKEQWEHEFAHRRAADVAGAHEQYFHAGPFEGAASHR